MAHIYCRNGKFKNVNCPFALVGGRVFGSIFEAEQYCTDNGLDPNVWVESDSSQVLDRCKEIARYTLPMLELWQEQMRIEYATIYDKATREAIACKKAEAEKKLGWEVHRLWTENAFGMTSGYYEAKKFLHKQWYTLTRILWHTSYTEK